MNIDQKEGPKAIGSMTITHLTRKSFPEAVPKDKLLPWKWCTEVFESMA